METISAKMRGARYGQEWGLAADDDQQSTDGAANSASKLMESRELL